MLDNNMRMIEWLNDNNFLVHRSYNVEVLYNIYS